jgi:hypothetical protein
MLLNLLTCAVLAGVPAAAIWLAGRMMHVPSSRRPGPAVTGSPWIEAEYAFDQAFAAHRRRHYAAVLIGRADHLNLPCLDDAAPFGRLGQRPVGERVVALRHIIGTVDGASHIFDREFRPTHRRARDRFQSVYVAMRTGEPLPPLHLYRWHGDYYVADGHHRVAAARMLGQDYLAGRVTDISG